MWGTANSGSDLDHQPTRLRKSWLICLAFRNCELYDFSERSEETMLWSYELILSTCVLSMLICGMLAKHLHRPVVNWLLIGLVLNIFAVALILLYGRKHGIPPREGSHTAGLGL
jgi:hypothetical protein